MALYMYIAIFVYFCFEEYLYHMEFKFSCKQHALEQCPEALSGLAIYILEQQKHMVGGSTVFLF